MAIRQLSPETVNRIAAGEVVERPGERRQGAGRERHRRRRDRDRDRHRRWRAIAHPRHRRRQRHGRRTTSHSASSATPPPSSTATICSHIHTLGFRGEALPSIGAIAPSRHRLASARRRDALEIAVDRGAKQPPRSPAALNPGTRIEVRDLFSATPARLKFLKSERAENLAVSETVKRLAMAASGRRLLADHGRAHGACAFRAARATAEGLLAAPRPYHGPRVRGGRACQARGERDGIVRQGLRRATDVASPGCRLAVPVRQRPPGARQAGRSARCAPPTAIIVPQGRHPLLALFVELPPSRGRRQRASGQDEVRFRDGGRRARSLDRRPARRSGSAPASAPAPKAAPARSKRWRDARNGAPFATWRCAIARAARATRRALPNMRRKRRSTALDAPSADAARTTPTPSAAGSRATPARRGTRQLHETYIVAQTRDVVIIVDQHAAHERLVYERMKKTLANGGVTRQGLLIPAIVELGRRRSVGARREGRPSWPSSASCSSRSAPPPSPCVRHRPCSAIPTSTASCTISPPSSSPKERPRR